MKYEDALDRALSMAYEPESLDAFLRTVPQWRDDLQRALTVSGSVALELRGIGPDAGARQRAQHRLMAQVERLGEAGNSSVLAGLLRAITGYRLGVAALTTAAFIVLAFAVGLPSLSGGGTQTAEAVIEGSVAEVSLDAVTISTNDSSRVIRLSSDTVLTDGFGNSVQSSKLSAGQDVVLKGSNSGDDFVASEVELRDRLFGVVTGLPGDGIQLNSPKGDFFISVTAQTEFEGAVQVGSFVEIKLARLADGSLRALEVEVEDEGDDDHQNEQERGGNESSGSSSSGSSSGPPSLEEQSQGENSGSSKVDDEGDHEEDRGGHSDEAEDD